MFGGMFGGFFGGIKAGNDYRELEKAIEQAV
jgi:hypothetical protein